MHARTIGEYGITMLVFHPSGMSQSQVRIGNNGKIRRSENDSTLGQLRSENANISWVWPFHTMICFMVNYIMPPNFRPKYDFLNIIFLVQAYHGKCQSSVERPMIGQIWPFLVAICFMVLCIISLNCRPISEILRVRVVKSSLGPGLAYSGNFKVPWNAKKLAQHGHF